MKSHRILTREVSLDSARRGLSIGVSRVGFLAKTNFSVFEDPNKLWKMVNMASENGL